MTSFPTSRLQRRRHFFRRLRLYAYVSGSILALVGIAYFFIGSSVFNITELRVIGVEDSEQEKVLHDLRAQVAEHSLGWLGTNHYFAWTESLSYQTPLVANITIEKKFWPRSITITATPRDRFAVWCSTATDAECFWVDAGGILFAAAPVSEGQIVQTIFDTATSTMSRIGEPVLASSSFAYIKKIMTAAQELNLSIHTMTVNRPLQELWLDTSAGARIRVSLRFDPEPTAIPAIIRFSKNPGFHALEYLNLTVENRAFVKYR